jgi:hypothetical protein
MNRFMMVSKSFSMMFLVFILCISFAFSADNPNSTEPKISPVEPDYNFGRAPEGKNIEHIFKIHNTGGSDLVIHQAKGS